MSHPAESPSAPAESSEDSTLNTAISLAVALAGTFMALSSVKTGNLAQAMQDAQARKINNWSYFQAKSTKQNLAEGSLEQLRTLHSLSPQAPPEVLAALEKKITDLQQKIERYEREKAEIKAEAEAMEKKYDALNEIDDQFDLSDAAMSVGIALAGVSALVKRRSLFTVSVVFLAFGFFMGACAFLGFSFEIPFLSKWLS